jgi:response regulator of citrate/malate metabolism
MGGAMKRYSCILIEDDAMAIDMINDYINRRDDLVLLGIGSELAEVNMLLQKLTPSIIFLDLIIPPGESNGFHLGQLPASSCIAIISGIPLHLYKGPLPPGPIFELSKPISYESFSRCVEKIVLKLKSEICESPDTI